MASQKQIQLRAQKREARYFSGGVSGSTRISSQKQIQLRQAKRIARRSGGSSTASTPIYLTAGGTYPPAGDKARDPLFGGSDQTGDGGSIFSNPLVLGVVALNVWLIFFRKKR